MHPGTEAEHVGVVVLACQGRRFEVVPERGPRTAHLVGSDLLAVARTPDHDPQAAGIGHHPLGGVDAEGRVVVLGVIAEGTAVRHLVPGGAKSIEQCPLQLEARVIAAQVNAHTTKSASRPAADNGGVAASDLYSSAPSTSAILTAWTLQPVAILLAGAALIWYLRLVRRGAPATGWPRWRTGVFLTGLALLVVLSCGPPSVYGRTVYWVWVSQALTLLLVVPFPLMCGQPVELSRQVPGTGLLARLVESRAGSVFTSPLVGPALVPVVCVAALFGPVPGWAAEYAGVNWLVQLALVLLGALVVLPLVSANDRASSIAVGASVAVGFVELLLDAVPGIVLRLSTKPVSGFFDHRSSSAFAPAWLHDQQLAGAVLWCVAELLDLPFLALVFGRWLRADAREARAADRELDAAEAALAEQRAAGQLSAVAEGEQPWFVHDPQLRNRLR